MVTPRELSRLLELDATKAAEKLSHDTLDEAINSGDVKITVSRPENSLTIHTDSMAVHFGLIAPEDDSSPGEIKGPDGWGVESTGKGVWEHAQFEFKVPASEHRPVLKYALEETTAEATFRQASSSAKLDTSRNTRRSTTPQFRAQSD